MRETILRVVCRDGGLTYERNKPLPDLYKAQGMTVAHIDIETDDDDDPVGYRVFALPFTPQEMEQIGNMEPSQLEEMDRRGRRGIIVREPIGENDLVVNAAPVSDTIIEIFRSLQAAHEAHLEQEGIAAEDNDAAEESTTSAPEAATNVAASAAQNTPATV